jgi:cytoskeletal protein CcmA (bactofilin family)
MKKRQVGYNRLADEDDFNLLADYQEDNVQLFAQDCGFAGCYLSGGAVTPHSPVSWKVILGISAARDDNGDRIKIASPETIDMEPSGDPGVGNEVYMSAFLSYTATETVPDVDGHGVAYYKDYDDGYAITVVEGTAASSGAATPPSIPAGKLCICDVLVTHAVYVRGNIQTADISISRQVEFTWPSSLSSITVDGDITCTDDISYDGTLTGTATTGTSIDVGGDVLVGGDLDVDGAADFAGDVEFAGTLTGSATTGTSIDVGGDVHADGSIETDSQLISNIITGTKPIDVDSTTVCTNLNADKVDGCDVQSALTDSSAHVPRSDTVYDKLLAKQALNYIMNGDMSNWQRGTSLSANGYIADRFKIIGVGSTVVQSRQAVTIGDIPEPSPKYCHRTVVTSAAGAGNYSILNQYIESVYSLAGKTVTLSFYAKADAAKPISIEFYQHFGSGGTPSAGVSAIGVKKITLSTSLVKYTVTASIPAITGKTLGTNGDDAVIIHFWFDAGSDFNARTDTLGQQSGTFDITRVMLNEGETAHEFVPFGGTYVSDYEACLRYCYATKAQYYTIRMTAYTANDMYFAANFVKPMRVQPWMPLTTEVTYFQVLTIATVAQTGFTIGLSGTGGDNPLLTLHKIGHGLTDGYLELRNMVFDAEL